MNEINVESLLAWGAPSRVNTANGPRLLRKAQPTPMFWAAWRGNKSACQAAGLSCRPVDGTWEALWWSVEGEPAASIPGNAPASAARQMARSPMVLPAGLVLSDEQVKIVSWFKDGKGNLVVRARAGTGKTFTIILAIAQASERRKLYAVFNKENQLEAEAKISDPNVDVLTLHALGFRFIKAVWPQSKPDDSVETDRIVACVPQNTPVDVIGQIGKLVGFAKNCFAGIPCLEDMMDLADARGIETSVELEESGWDCGALASSAIKVLKLSMDKDAQNRISFNDMVWLPVAMGWVCPAYDLVVVDEAQDMNLPQLLMARQSCTKDGRVAMVGDDRQAIYGFRGAAANGIDMMKSKLNAQEVGLTITRRCPQAVVSLAAEYVPDYKAAPEAPLGVVANVGEPILVNVLKVGDAVLSRANAPLMPICLSLLRKGIPAAIRGRDVGAQLAAIARKFKAKHVPHFLERVEGWQKKQIARAMTSKKYAEEKCAVINDQAACLVAVAEGCACVDEIFVKLNEIFLDKEGFKKPCVTLSSVHKAKGLEWDNVYLIAETFRPERGGEEENIYYVGITRAKKTLTFVAGRKGKVQEN